MFQAQTNLSVRSFLQDSSVIGINWSGLCFCCVHQPPSLASCLRQGRFHKRPNGQLYMGVRCSVWHSPTCLNLLGFGSDFRAGISQVVLRDFDYSMPLSYFTSWVSTLSVAPLDRRDVDARCTMQICDLLIEFLWGALLIWDHAGKHILCLHCHQRVRSMSWEARWCSALVIGKRRCPPRQLWTHRNCGWVHYILRINSYSS